MGLKTPKNKTDQLRAIQYGRGIQHILDEAYKILGYPIVIHDMEYKMIAFTSDAVCDDPIWNDFMTYGRLGAQTIEFIKNEGFIDDVANSTMQNGITYLLSDKLKYGRVFGQLFNKERMPVADLVVVENDARFGDDALEITKIICDVLSEELGKSAYYQDYGQVYQENILKELIEGSIEDKEIYVGHIANIDSALKSYIYVMVVDIAQCDPEYDRLVYFRDLFKQIQPDYKYYIYHNYIVILVSSDDKIQDEQSELEELCTLFEQNNIYAGISSGFENLFEMSKYYREAVNALNLGLESDRAYRIFSYDAQTHGLQE